MVETSQKSKSPKDDVGSVFISNYPPYSFWNDQKVEELIEAFDEAPKQATPMGLYLHIPFCRKRCKFCYFKVYTDKNSKEIQAYLDAVKRETETLAKMKAIQGRPLNFVYIGGGTPSYISARHLRGLMDHVSDTWGFDHVEEFTFECEPGTLTEKKLEAIKEVGVTRLSLGVENFDDDILKENGRAHVSTEVYRVQPWIKAQQFDQLNIDLISGMVGETWQNWKDNIQKAIDYDPDSITIYQLELPYNTVYSGGILKGQQVPDFADWNTKREWHHYAIETLQAADFEISSGYTMVKRDRKVKFQYRDNLWRGSDLIGAGVSSFGHLKGYHYQNEPSINLYNDYLTEGKLPIKRAFSTTPRNRLIREMILQMKMGHLQTGYFQEKFGVNILREFQNPFEIHQRDGFLEIGESGVQLTRKGLLQVDSLLPAFYEAQYQNARYT